MQHQQLKGQPKEIKKGNNENDINTNSNIIE